MEYDPEQGQRKGEVNPEHPPHPGHFMAQRPFQRVQVRFGRQAVYNTLNTRNATARRKAD